MFDSGTEAHIATYQSMLNDFGSGKWDGELDSFSVGVEPEVWRPVTTDHRGCTNKRCSYFRQCPFFKARNKLDGADVIVANHDLVLADLSLGGGAVLPEPEDCIFIIDEAHHLPDKTQQHFSVSARMRSSRAWIEQVNSVIGTLTQRFGRPHELVQIAGTLAAHSAEFNAALDALDDAMAELVFTQRDETVETHRFKLGSVPAAITAPAAAAAGPMDGIAQAITSVHELLQKAFEGEVSWPQGFESEDWLPVVGQLATRAQATCALLHDYSQADAQASSAPVLHARWINRYEMDLELVSAPIQPGRLLVESLWLSCYGAICTSATLTALGRFDRFFERSGLQELVASRQDDEQNITGVRIPSPFDFPRIATLAVPDMASDPRDFDAHSEEVAFLLPALLADGPSGLVLFTSWRQLNAVIRLLPEDFTDKLKIQGEGSKQALLQAHRQCVDKGEASFIAGLASFAEGVDLPDDYCRHVVIVKLPFAVPDDPIDQAMAEWAESQGKNAFYEISVPDAALKLVQACGRLIRHEEDYGRISLLDRRIVTQRYGRALLESLPPYRLET